MTARQFYDWQTLGGAKDVSRLVAVLEDREIPWCMIDGLAVNHWAAEPMATAYVDLVIATDKIEDATAALKDLGFAERRFEWSINFKGESGFHPDQHRRFLQRFPGPRRSRQRPRHPHAGGSLEDTLAGKLKAYREPDRRPSKRQKDLADLSRLIESHPEIQSKIPEAILSRLES